MVLDRLTSAFEEPVEVERLADAEEVFREERSEELAAAREEADQLQQSVEQALQELEVALQELEGYDDRQGRTMVEDVVDNVAAERQRLLERFTVADEPRQLHDDLDAFIDDFRTMKPKETEILKAIGADKQAVFDALDAVEQQHDRLARFLDADYTVLEQYHAVKEHVADLQRLREEKQERAAELEDIDLAEFRADIEGAEEQLDRLHDSGEWTEYQRLQDELDDVREKRDAARESIAAAMSRMERGLKKLLYEVDNGDAALPRGRDVLEDIRDGNVEAVLDRPPKDVAAAVAAADDAIPDGLLGERQRDRFSDAVATLADIGAHAETLAEFEERAAALEQQIEEHEAPGREDELQDALDAAQERLNEKREEREELRAAVGRLEEEIAEQEDQLRELLDEAFPAGIELS